MIDYPDAVDAMFSQFNTEWAAGTTAICGYVPQVFWDGVESATALDTSKYWARVSEQQVTSEQSTFRNESMKKRQRNHGLIFVQVFAPRSVANSMDIGRKLANYAKNIFKGKSTNGRIWYRNSRVLTLSPEEMYNRFNVVSEYEHDEESS